MIDPQNRVVLVSGANRGIGHAIAICLHDKGYTISAGARDVDALGEALAHLGMSACCWLTTMPVIASRRING